MINVKLTTQDPLVPTARQTPGSKGIWGNCRFFVNDNSRKEFDWWFVKDGMANKETASLPREHTVLVATETNAVKDYKKNFLDQFHYCITSQREMSHPRKTYYPVARWMVGHVGGRSGINPKDFPKYFTPYDTYKTMKWPEKRKLISVTTSHKNHTEGHRKRLMFINALKKHFGDRMDVFGAGINFVRDKFDSLAPYKYHLALENHQELDYMTEKITDAYIGFTFPFYSGCPNIADYFDPRAFIAIDIHDPAGAINKIERAIADNIYENRIEDIRGARNLSLDKYNMFAIMTNFVHEHSADAHSDASSITLVPEKKPFASTASRELRDFPILYTVIRLLYRTYRTLRYPNGNNK